jgi:hypothetical protein
MKQLTSIFQKNYNELMSIQDVDTLKDSVSNVTQGINAVDRNKVLRTLQTLNTLTAVQMYITNSMFKYQGMGVR